MTGSDDSPDGCCERTNSKESVQFNEVVHYKQVSLGVDHLIFEGGVGRIGQRKNFFSCCPMVQAIFFVHKGFAGIFFPCDICCRKFFFSNLI